MAGLSAARRYEQDVANHPYIPPKPAAKPALRASRLKSGASSPIAVESSPPPPPPPVVEPPVVEPPPEEPPVEEPPVDEGGTTP